MWGFSCICTVLLASEQLLFPGFWFNLLLKRGIAKGAVEIGEKHVLFY